ncbi:MAG: hypothetical protein SNJ49_05215 [Chloracidobacterium sp.]
MRTLICILGLIIISLFPTSMGTAQDDNGKPLSLEQIKRLIQNDFPDTALAGEIRDRGIDFSNTFDRKTLETLRLLGAQEKTLRALEPYLPKAAIRVVTRLDRTTVLVDGKQYGVTDSTGILQINDLEPGEHLIETRNRPKYKDGQIRVVLAPRDNQDVVFEPELNVGSLTITPLTPNLEVVVYNELASLTGSFARRELTPGVYTLQAKSRWHRPITQIIQIKSGQNLTLPVELELDEDLIEETILDAKKSFSSKDYTKSVNTLLEILTILPRHLPALNLLAQNYLRLNDTPNFTAAAKRILDADGMLDFNLVLHTEKKAPQPVRLQLSRSNLRLAFLESDETQTFPLESFSRVFIRGDVQSEVFLVLAGTRAPKRLPDLQFSLANTYDPRGEGPENQLSQRDKINFLWNIEEVLRFSLEVHREFLAVNANPNRATPTSPSPSATSQTKTNDPAVTDETPPKTKKDNDNKKDRDKKKDNDKQRAQSDTEASDTKEKPPAPLTDQATARNAPRDDASSAPPASSSQPTKAKPLKPAATTNAKPIAKAESRPSTAAAPPPRPMPPVVDDAPTGAPSPVRARVLIGTMVGAVGGRANIERVTAAQFYGTQITTEPDLATPESTSDPKPIRQLWARARKLRFEVSPGSPTGLLFLRSDKLFWQRANGRTEPITQRETLKQVRIQSKLAGIGLYQQLLLPGNELIRFSRHLSDGQVEETIRITDADGDTYDVVIDLESRLPRKCAYQLPTDIGQPLQIEERYEDFKPVGGILLPHRIVRSVQGGRTVTLTFTDIQFLPGFSGDPFRKP